MTIRAFVKSLSKSKSSGIISSVFATPASSEPTLTVNSTKTIVQKAGKWMGRASILVRDDGVIVMTYIEAPSHGFYATTIGHIRFSDDYGETWSDEDEYIDGTAIDGFPLELTYDPVICRLVKCPNGDFLVHTWNTTTSNIALGAHQMRSTDGGLTWAAPSSLAFSNYAPQGGSALNTYFNTDYTVVGDVIYAPNRHYVQSGGEVEESFWCISDDNGQTWQVSTRMSSMPNPIGGTNGDPPTKGAGEIGLTYIGNDQFVSVARISSINAIYRFDIDNSGESPVITNSSINSDVDIAAGRLIMHQRAKLKGVNEWWRDPVIFVFGFEFTVPGQGRERRHLMLASKNKGESWLGPFYIDQTWNDCGYGDAFYNPISGEYVFVSYVAETVNDKAYLKQYNISIEWD